MSDNIKVSIITPSFNSAKTIEKTIQSIIGQTYKNIEYIIIDGGSTDGTLEIIKRYQDRITYWSSEPDRGISDAFNKGLTVATGDYLNFQGADDYLLADDVIDSMMANINPLTDILICGVIERVSVAKDKEIIFKTKPKFSGKHSLLFRMSLPHQALFTHKSFFQKYGIFDLKNKFCMDYELLLRAYKEFPKVIMKNIAVSAWSEGGIGKDRTLEIYKEYLAIKKRHKIAPALILQMIYWWSILKFYLKNI